MTVHRIPGEKKNRARAKETGDQIKCLIWINTCIVVCDDGETQSDTQQSKQIMFNLIDYTR